MLRSFIHKLLFVLLFTPTTLAYSQKQKKLSAAEVDRYKENIHRLISFFEYSLNTIGSDSTSVEDKEEIIYTSYSKIFKNDKVLIEDDLDENRKVPAYKSVQAYLQDIDYFFQNVQFGYHIEDISFSENESGEYFFKTSLSRKAKGITINHDTVENTLRRYIELMVDIRSKDIKIASIYTTKLNEEEELVSWWNNLHEEWKSILQEQAIIKDSVQYDQLKKICSLEKIDLSGKRISGINPLNKLNGLKELRLSRTFVKDLTPLRNCSKLEILVIDSTPVSSLQLLDHLSNLKELSINSTGISDLTPVKHFRKLEKLYCSGTSISSLDSLKQLIHLKELDCSNTAIQQGNVIENFRSLEVLNVSRTGIDNLGFLTSLSNLNKLYFSNTAINNLGAIKHLEKISLLAFNNTPVKSLEPINGLTSLKKIYCDSTAISQEDAISYIRQHPDVLVVYQAGNLIKWWNGLSVEWKKIFKKYIQADDLPTEKQLASVRNIDTLNISGNTEILTLPELAPLVSLKVLKANHTKISNIEAITTVVHLQELEFSDTKVNNLNGIEKLKNLRLLNCDETQISNTTITRFIKENSNCLVIYRSSELQGWWDGLDNEWKEAFHQHLKMNEVPDKIQLHVLVKQDSISLNNKRIDNLNPLQKFSELDFLRVSNTNVNSLDGIKKFRQLTRLEFPDNPIKDLSPLENLKGLKSIDCSNTAIENLKPLSKINKLESLKCSGTQIKTLKPIEQLKRLTYLDFSNTRVKNISPIQKINTLKTVVCYNTALSKKETEAFIKAHPDSRLIFY